MTQNLMTTLNLIGSICDRYDSTLLRLVFLILTSPNEGDNSFSVSTGGIMDRVDYCFIILIISTIWSQTTVSLTPHLTSNTRNRLSETYCKNTLIFIYSGTLLIIGHQRARKIWPYKQGDRINSVWSNLMTGLDSCSLMSIWNAGIIKYKLKLELECKLKC